MRQIRLVIAIILVTLAAAACDPGQISTTTTTNSTPPGGATFGQFAAAGSAVFNNYCGACHGAGGEGGIGPRVIGPGHGLSDYATAQGLSTFINQNMPLGAAGSLSQQQYQEVLAFLLVQNSLVSSGAAFNPSQLGSVSLTSNPTQTSTTPVTTPTTPPLTAGATYGQAATVGVTIYAAYCSSCHGANGQGGIGDQLIGPGQDLGGYDTAQGLLTFIRQNMPMNAPGSLTETQYLYVLTFLMTENSFIPRETVFAQANLPLIILPDSDD